MQAILGAIFHFIGGFASGSFYVPYRKVRGWAWESHWIIGGLASWLLVPFPTAYLTVPSFLGIIQAADPNTLFWTYFLGLLWGIGGLTFGLGLRYLDISLGQTVMLGLSAAFGALMPPLYRDIVSSTSGETLSGMLSATGGQVVLLGIFVCLVGIAISGKAGVMKENDMTEEQKQTGIKEFNLSRGITVALVSGILSACFNYAIEAGKPMAEIAVQMGSNPLFQNNVTFMVILWGGLTTNFIWCMLLNIKNRTFSDYTDKEIPLVSNYLFYGMGESKLGNGANSWILHMAFVILISNVWALYWASGRECTREPLRPSYQVLPLSFAQLP
jgi:L-rhamnose-H+ transport protein